MSSIIIRPDGSSRSEIGGSRLRQVIDTLRRAATKRNEIPKDDLIDAVDEFAQYSSIRGLSNESLNALIDILTTPTKLDQTTTTAIVRNLYPRNKVPEEIVVKIVGCFGQGQSKPLLSTQAILLRWLVMVYDVLEGYTSLSKLYGLLFNCLDMISLRAHMCHLLSFITRRKHVKPFRIQSLLELKRIVGNEQPLLGLLQIYKDYYPDVIVERLAPTKSGLFSHPNPDWMQRLLVIQEANALGSATDSEKSSFQVVRKHGGQGGKRRKTRHLTVPEVRTYKTVETSVTLEEIGTVDDFVAKLDRLELPNQLAAVIEDPLLQNFLDLRPSEQDQPRINNWVSAYLSCAVGDRLQDYMKKVLQYTKHTQKLLPAVESFLETSLLRNSLPLQLELVLELLVFLPLGHFKDLHTRFFSPIDKIADNTSANTRLIHFYTDLLRKWLSLHSSPPTFSPLPIDVENSIVHYMQHVGSLVVRTLNGSQVNRICYSALLFYEVAASFPLRNGIFRLVLPPDTLVYHSLFAGDTLSLSRMCGILAKYKQNAEEILKVAQPSHNGGFEPSPAYTDHLNGLVMDVVDCVWRSKGFSRADNSLEYPVSRELVEKNADIATSRGEDLRQLYSLTRSIALAGYAKKAFSALEVREHIANSNRHRGPPTQESLKNLAAADGLNIPWREFKKEALKDLQSQGLVGLPELMYGVIAAFSSE